MVELYDPSFQQTTCDEDINRIDCTDFLTGINIRYDGEFHVVNFPTGFKFIGHTIFSNMSLFQ